MARRTTTAGIFLAAGLAAQTGCSLTGRSHVAAAPAEASETAPPTSSPMPSSVTLAFTEGSERSVSERLVAETLPAEMTRGLDAGHAPSATQITYTFDGADFDPSISPDGSLLVYASTQHRPTPDIYAKRIGSSVITQLTNDPASEAMPVISPDGSRVAFCSDRSGNWDIYVMSISGGHAVQLTSDGAPELHPSWSPDGTRLAYSRFGQTSGRWEMWVVDATNPEIAEFIGYGMFPEWCPTAGTGQEGGDRILFQRSRERGDRAFGLWTLEYNRGRVSNLTQLIASPLAAFINASWSPDGSHIVFATVPTPSQWPDGSGGQPPSSVLWMMPVDGGTRVALTGGDAIDLMPTWAPDNRVYFISNRGGTDNIWSLDLSDAMLAATGKAPASRSVITGAGVRSVPMHAPEKPVVHATEGHD